GLLHIILERWPIVTVMVMAGGKSGSSPRRRGPFAGAVAGLGLLPRASVIPACLGTAAMICDGFCEVAVPIRILPLSSISSGGAAMTAIQNYAAWKRFLSIRSRCHAWGAESPLSLKLNA